MWLYLPDPKLFVKYIFWFITLISFINLVIHMLDLLCLFFTYHFLPNLFEILVLFFFPFFSTILYIVCSFPHFQFNFCAHDIYICIHRGGALHPALCWYRPLELACMGFHALWFPSGLGNGSPKRRQVDLGGLAAGIYFLSFCLQVTSEELHSLTRGHTSFKAALSTRLSSEFR